MGKVFGWMFYFAFLVAIFIVGWEKPLKVRFWLKPAPAVPKTASAPAFAPNQSQSTSPSWMTDQHRWDTTNHATSVPTTPTTSSGALQ